ncbi:MAG: YncE family protein [Solirubrobacteraceae bacterium]
MARQARFSPIWLGAVLAVAVACARVATTGGVHQAKDATGIAAVAGSCPMATAASMRTGPRRLESASRTAHLEYVFDDGCTYVYNIDAGGALLETIPLPDSAGVRGAAVSTATGTLYVSYGGDGGGYGGGAMLAYSLTSHVVLWVHNYPEGIDSMAVNNSGTRIYLPSGELNESGKWYVVDARTGSIVDTISGGDGAHNTVVGPSGKTVYLGGRNSNYLTAAATRTDRIIKRIGPLVNGVRPFTINGAETLAYTTATGFLGFQISSLVSGRVLYTVPVSGFGWNPATFHASAPSHGISLTPNEHEVWVIDGPNSYVHAFSLSGVPAKPPRPIASVSLTHPFTGEKEDCAYDCTRDGWLQSSLDGSYMFVGDSGDVISTRSKRVVAYLPAMRNTRVMLEVEWQGGRTVQTSTRVGLGHVRRCVSYRRRPRRRRACVP